MAKHKRDAVREERIHNEAVVDAHGPEEQAMGWYYYLEDKIRFPFQAKCMVAKVVSPLPIRKDCRSPGHGCRRCLLQRHARSDPVAWPERGSSLVSTDRHRRKRVYCRGHRGLALLGGTGLLLLTRRRHRILIYATAPKAHEREQFPVSTFPETRPHSAEMRSDVLGLCRLSWEYCSAASRRGAAGLRQSTRRVCAAVSAECAQSLYLPRSRLGAAGHLLQLSQGTLGSSADHERRGAALPDRAVADQCRAAVQARRACGGHGLEAPHGGRADLAQTQCAVAAASEIRRPPGQRRRRRQSRDRQRESRLNEFTHQLTTAHRKRTDHPSRGCP